MAAPPQGDAYVDVDRRPIRRVRSKSDTPYLAEARISLNLETGRVVLASRCVTSAHLERHTSTSRLFRVGIVFAHSDQVVGLHHGITYLHTQRNVCVRCRLRTRVSGSALGSQRGSDPRGSPLALSCYRLPHFPADVV
ncbi:phosphatase and actin regulator 1-like isoform X1 [Arapaima gigas]